MADKPIETTYAVYHALSEYAGQKQNFTTAELREKLGYDERSSEADRMHAVINSRKKDGIIDVVPDGRKRHQHLLVKPDRVEDLQRLMYRALRKRRMNGSDPTNTNIAPITTPKRVVYLEDRIEGLEKDETRREQKLDQVVSELAALKEEVRHLVELWS